MIYTFGSPGVPSVRFRIFQYIPLLEQSFDVTVSSDKPRLSDVLYNDVDICFFQKNASSTCLNSGILVQKAKWVFDYDDMVWMPSEGTWERYSKIRTRLRFLGTTFFSDLVITSSRFLAHFSLGRNTVVIPVSTPQSQFRAIDDEFTRKWSSDTIIFGWAGKAQSRYQLEYLLKVCRITGLNKSNFVILSGEPPSLDIEYEYLPFTEENEKSFFLECMSGWFLALTDRLITVNLRLKRCSIFHMGVPSSQILEALHERFYRLM